MIHKRNYLSPAFTIVELLIVIVVVAILAAISAVAYTGIKDRAFTSRLKSDINQITKVIQIHAARENEIPICPGGSGESCPLSSLSLPDTSTLPTAQSDTYYYVGTSSDQNWSVRAAIDQSVSGLCKFGYYPNSPTWWSSAPAC